MEVLGYILSGVGVLAIIAAVIIANVLSKTKIDNFKQQFYVEQQNKADNIVLVANERAKTIELEARDKSLRLQQDAESELTRRRSEIVHEEERLQKRRTELDHRTERMELREQAINKRQSALDKRANDIEKMAVDKLAELQKVANMSVDEARAQLLQEVEKESRDDMARIIRQIEAEARADGEKRAREIVADAIQRVASDHVAAVSTSVVPLPNEEMKGRIVGRNGRNIRAFEQAAGVDVIVDDTPEAVTISCFDPVRREVARRSLERLIVDGRIHPAHIEKILNDTQREVDKDIVEAGEQAVFEAGVAGLHPEIIRVLGRLRFRTSYGQNQLAHAVEVARLSAVIAADLGADVDISRAAGLLHDLGKAMDHNVDGTHASIGAEFAKRYGVHPRVVNAIAAHHHEVEQESVEAVIAEAADAISGARPGARREDLEQYIKRLRALEDIATSFKGVSQSYAIQAGREVRIIVRPEDIDDLAATRLARDIAKKIEETMQYPGQIKVTVIRETRAVEYAK
ncbi:MAG TPA: ribonuclease Y [Anaerolineaceae bacterium]|nr:ribonuclease Y [Anaerolineaceae bacterium]HQF61099.1 ribonuclease Y [Anaerolineaceae bacterium]HQH85367.1 ribonuclease Y [Anaerolineaceae bacterium]